MASDMQPLLELFLTYAFAAAGLFLIQVPAATGIVVFFLGSLLWLGFLLHAFMIHVLVAVVRGRLPRWAAAIPVAFYATGLALFACGQRDVAALEQELAQRENAITIYPGIAAVVLTDKLEFYSDHGPVADFRKTDPALAIYQSTGPQVTNRIELRHGEACRSVPDKAESFTDAEKTSNRQCAIKTPAALPSRYFLVSREWSQTIAFDRTFARARVQPITIHAVRPESTDPAALVYAGDIQFIAPVIFPVIGCGPDLTTDWSCGRPELWWSGKRHGPYRYGRAGELLAGLWNTLAKAGGLQSTASPGDFSR